MINISKDKYDNMNYGMHSFPALNFTILMFLRKPNQVTVLFPLPSQTP